MNQQIEQKPISALIESPNNPRKTYCETALQELAETIKQVGIQQPIKVRPLPLMGDDAHFTYEIIFGHRRYRAAKLAGLELVPCIVEDMPDHIADRVRLIENIQRDDVTPIEEAESIERLMNENHLNAEQVGELLGLKRTVVYNKLKLLQASEAVRKACAEGLIGAEIATRIARHPKSIQPQALKRVLIEASDTRPGFEGKKRQAAMPNEQALPILKGHFTESLKHATFSLSATHLQAPACTTCPNNSDNTAAIREDFGPGTCIDKDCFSAKRMNHITFQIEDAKAQGLRVFEGAESERIAPGGRHWSFQDGWENIDHIEVDKPGSNEDDDERLGFTEMCELAPSYGHIAPVPAILVLPPVDKQKSSPPRLVKIITDQEAQALRAVFEGEDTETFSTEGTTARTDAEDLSEDDIEAEDSGSPLYVRASSPKPDTRPPEVRAVFDTWQERICLHIAPAVKATKRSEDDLRTIANQVTAWHLLHGCYLPDCILHAFGWTREQIEEQTKEAHAYSDDDEAFARQQIAQMSNDDLATYITLMCINATSPHEDQGQARLNIAAQYGIEPVQAAASIEPLHPGHHAPPQPGTQESIFKPA